MTEAARRRTRARIRLIKIQWLLILALIVALIIKPENITLKTALKLAQALDCQPEDLTKPDKEESDV